MILLQIILNSLITGSILALNASGFTLIYGSMRFFNMAYGINAMVGAFIFYVLFKLCALPIYISIIIACIVTAILMLLIDRTCYYGFRQKRVPEWASVVVSMGVATIVTGIVTMIFGSQGIQIMGGEANSINIFGAYITVPQVIMFFSALAIMFGFTTFLKKAKTGKLIRALSNDKQMAYVVGIDAEKVFMAIIVVGSILATISGIFYGIDSNIRPYMSSLLMGNAISIAIIGGVGNIKGTMLAGFLLGAIQNICTYFIGSGWRDAVPLVLILVVMMLKPSAFGIAENN